MADYRLIFRNAATGERTSSLSHLGFRVWVQYQLSADDFGVCPALAAKLQGDNPALLDETPKRIQAEIENLIRLGLCRSFTDGRRRYLYQHDWQNWQRLRYPVSTALPAVPAELLRECSGETQELFTKHYARASGKLPPHASACDAPANADADADALSEGVQGEPAIVAQSTPIRFVSPAQWARQHGQHVSGFCDWLCLPESVVDGFVRRLMGAGTEEGVARAQTLAWAKGVRQAWAGRVPGDDIFAFWRNEWAATHGSNKPAASASAVDPLAGVKEALRRG
jgi:hypothetical protein